MCKKVLSITLTLVTMLGVMCISVSALQATPTASTVLVNGQNIAFDAYEINGNNYFKLRDLAYTLNGTAKQFAVGWDGATNAISLASGQAYTAVGGEMTGKGAGTKTPAPTSSKILLDGKEISFTAYEIEGNNYFKLRDIGASFNFGVDWDGARNTIVIDTSKGYTAEGPTTPPSGNQSVVGAWSGVPTLQIGNVKSWIEFKSNGTFTHYNEVTKNTPYYQKFELTTTGNYTVSDGKIYCTNVKETYNAGRTSNEYENKPVDDCIWLYKFEVKPWENTIVINDDAFFPEYDTEYVDVLWLQVNFYPNSSDNALNKYEEFAKPFED